MINQHLFMLLAFLFVMMIGLGIAQPVLLFYVERLALGAERVAPCSCGGHSGGCNPRYI